MSEKSDKSDKTAGEGAETRKKKVRKDKDPEVEEEHKKKRAERAEKLRRAEAELEEKRKATEQELLKQRAAEVAAAASAPKLVEPDPEAEFASLEATKLEATDTLEQFPRDVCAAFGKLLRHARDLNIQIAVPEIVFVGPRSAGKSYLIEALLGRVFNGAVSSAGTKRPLVINVSAGEKTKCVIKRDQFLKEFDRDTEVAPEGLAAELERRNAQFSPEPIVVQFESKELLSMTVIDTPGLIVDPSDGQSKPHEQLALRMIAPSNRIVVVVRQSSDAVLPPSATDYVLDLVKQVDPEFTRTAIVYTRLHAQLQAFQSSKAVNKFLAGTVPDVRTFFATMPAIALREKMADPASFRDKVLQASRRDLALLEQLQFDKRFQASIGVPALLRHITGTVWRSYQESAPRILKVLRQRKAETARAIADNAAQAEALTPAFFRVVASDYSMDFLRTLERLIRGTAEGNPAVNGQTLEQEKAQAGVDAQWVDARGIPISVDPDEWDVPHWQNKLYGGQQFERLLAEFKAVSDHAEIPELTRDDIATAAGIPKLHNVPNYSWAACDLARQKSQETFEPLINQLAERAVFVMKRLTDIADVIMADAAARRRGSSAGAAVASHAPAAGVTVAAAAHAPSAKRVDATNVELYPYFVHFVKDQFFKFIEETAKRCKETCLDEFYSTRTIFWDLTENEHIASVERTEQVAELTKTLFKRLKERITRNVLLKFYNHLLVPVETRLWSEMQRRVSELSDKSLEDLFEIASVREALANSDSRLKGDLKELEDKEKLLLEVATVFSHPASDK